MGASISNKLGCFKKISLEVRHSWRISDSDSWNCLPGLPLTSSNRVIMLSRTDGSITSTNGQEEEGEIERTKDQGFDCWWWYCCCFDGEVTNITGIDKERYKLWQKPNGYSSRRKTPKKKKTKGLLELWGCNGEIEGELVCNFIWHQIENCKKEELKGFFFFWFLMSVDECDGWVRRRGVSGGRNSFDCGAESGPELTSSFSFSYFFPRKTRGVII